MTVFHCTAPLCYGLQEGGVFSNKPGLTVQFDGFASYAESHHLSCCGVVGTGVISVQKETELLSFLCPLLGPLCDVCDVVVIIF